MRLLGKRLDGKKARDLEHALLDAFDLDRFDQMLYHQMNYRRERLAIGNNMESIVFRVIQRAEDESWTTELLQAARSMSPTNPELLAFAQQFGLTPVTPSNTLLQRTIREANGLLDPFEWRKILGKRENQVCLIEIDFGWPPVFGTGFLLAPNIVMTNYHVVENVINNNISPKNVKLKFDYRKMTDDSTKSIAVNPGTVYALDNNWLIDYSPCNPTENSLNIGFVEPSVDELDYALLRVNGEPGNEPIGGETINGSRAPLRGSIEILNQHYDFQPNSSLFILQHPNGEPLKLAIETQSVIGLNNSKTRVKYRTNTTRGSSGSPCFDGNWNLVALHHAGDPNFNSAHKPEYNQGVPFQAIFDLLEKRKILPMLGL